MNNKTYEYYVEKMNQHKEALVKIYGEEAFNEDLEKFKALDVNEKNKGKFVYNQDAIDNRDPSLKKTELSKGFNIVCGIKGGKLSGGQKQRVAIARTVIREPKVLMLDEATSALDEDSQKKVQLALEAASKNRTTIIIAHRMSTIEKCDKIFVLESGSLKEEGNFTQLKERKGTFAKLALTKK